MSESPPNKSVTDSAGRVIEYRPLKLMERLKVTEVLAQSWCEKTYNLVNAFAAAAVRSIDGNTVPFPSSHENVLANIELLDDHGMDAVRPAIDADAKADAEANKARAKN